MKKLRLKPCLKKQLKQGRKLTQLRNTCGAKTRNQRYRLLLNAIIFDMDLQKDLFGTNDGAPITGTFTRTSAATVTDFEGSVIDVLAEESRFWYARRVHNLVKGSTELISTQSNIIWGVASGVTITDNTTEVIDPDGGNRATKIYNDGSVPAGAYCLHNKTTIVGAVGAKYYLSQWVRVATGTKDLRITSNNGDAYSYTATTTWQKIEPPVVTDNGTSSAFAGVIRLNGSNVDPVTIYMYEPMFCFETGTLTSVEEYVSVGVLPAPYHGANVDGVKYFNTDRSGIALTGMRGILSESAATNLADTDLTGTQTIDVSANTGDYTISCEGSASFTLTMTGTSAGTISDATCTEASPAHVNLTTADTLTITLDSGTLDLSGANNIIQCENKAYNTSFIPSPTTAGVTRTADDLSVDIGTLVGDFSGTQDVTPSAIITGKATIAYLYDGTTNNVVDLHLLAGKPTLVVTTAGVEQVNIGSTTALVAGTKYAISIKVNENDFSIEVDGVEVATSTSGTVPAGLTELDIGHNNGSDHLEGGIQNAIN